LDQKAEIFGEGIFVFSFEHWKEF